MSMQESMLAFFNEHGVERTYVIGYSGGLDSQVLLSLSLAIRNLLPIRIKAVHIHHGLSPHADVWAEHCRAYCAANEIDFVAHHVTLDIQQGDSLEEKARYARYEAFASYLTDDDMLLTAHHLDDQAETMLLQLFRGAGPKGLSSMPVMKRFAAGYHGRPMLLVSRDEIRRNADSMALTWIEDESNENETLRRNFIRQQLLPMIKTQWPGVAAAISRSAAHCAELVAFADGNIAALLVQVAGNGKDTLSVSRLNIHPVSHQRLLVRKWIAAHGFMLPHSRKLDAILHDVVQARWDKMPCVAWADVVVRRYRDDIYLMKKRDVEINTESVHWQLHEPLALEGLGVLSAHKVFSGQRIRSDLQALTVAFRGHTGVESKLKKLYQEHAVPTWLRDITPVLMHDNKIVSIPGFYLNQQFASVDNAEGFQVVLQ